MTDLEQRLRDLGSSLDPGEPTPVADLRARARRRRSRRRFGAVGAVLAVLVLVTAAVRAGGEDVGEQVVAGPSMSAPPATMPGQLSIGDIAGVSIEVSPTHDLVDGQEMTVRVDGLVYLPGAQLVMCRGDVEQTTVFALCDLGAFRDGASLPAATSQTIRVSRFLTLPAGPVVDCANEPLGCVLGVGASSSSGTRGLAVPLQFRSAPPPPEPTLRVSRVADLADAEVLEVEGIGLRPGRTYALTQCTADRHVCSEPDAAGQGLATDADGAGRGAMSVSAAIYGSAGRVDCTTEPCVVGIYLRAFDLVVDEPISFAPSTRAPLPVLRIEPAGPYDDGQEVTVTGTGFPPGFDVARWLRMCPAHLDTAMEERCGYTPLSHATVVAAADGAFSASMVLQPVTGVGRCQDLPSGCVLAWVLNHGPIAASTPVRFR